MKNFFIKNKERIIFYINKFQSFLKKTEMYKEIDQRLKRNVENIFNKLNEFSTQQELDNGQPNPYYQFFIPFKNDSEFHFHFGCNKKFLIRYTNHVGQNISVLEIFELKKSEETPTNIKEVSTEIKFTVNNRNEIKIGNDLILPHLLGVFLLPKLIS